MKQILAVHGNTVGLVHVFSASEPWDSFRWHYDRNRTPLTSSRYKAVVRVIVCTLSVWCSVWLACDISRLESSLEFYKRITNIKD